MSRNYPHANVFVGLGSNLGDRAGNLLLGLRGLLNEGLEVMRVSQIYETEPVETFAQPIFLNLVVELRGNDVLQPQEVMARFKRVEQSLGRTREVAMAPRTIDLDLLIYGKETSSADYLTLPHPRLHLRKFVLVPLAEIAPTLIHPILNKTIAELLESVTDNSAVQVWTP